MSNEQGLRGVFRRLWSTEMGLLAEHLVRLDKHGRRMRFGHCASDAFIQAYAQGATTAEGIVYGYFEDGEMRAASELRKLGPTWREDAEAAFSVEKGYQDRGIGTELMVRIVRIARNRGVRRIHMSCLADNARMQAIARKERASIEVSHGEVLADIVPRYPSYSSLFCEAIDERVGFLFAVIDFQQRLSRQ